MDYNVTAEALQRVITPRTRAIILPHMFGCPADVESILKIGLPVIEDITLSLGAMYHDKPVGAWSDVSVCSFHASKMIACGEGGMLAAADPVLVAKARYLNGWAEEQPAARLNDRVKPFRLRYNFHLSDVAAALGRSQLRETAVIHRPSPCLGRAVFGATRPPRMPAGTRGDPPCKCIPPLPGCRRA